MDPYAVLGVPRDATDETIKSAYRKLAMQFHPDRNKEPGAEDRFKEISGAYEAIKDAERRAQTAAQGRPQSHGFEFRTGGGFPFGFEFEDIIRHMHGQRVQRNRDLNVNYEISLDQAFTGASANVSIRAESGEVRDITINIPAGVDSGMRLRVAGAGDRAVPHLPPGDLYVLVQVRPHPAFTRHGPNLVMNVRIDALDAMLGAKIPLTTIDGATLHVDAPRDSGALLRLAGQGMPTMGGARGDLLIQAVIETPKDLTEQQLTLLRQVRELRRQTA